MDRRTLRANLRELRLFAGLFLKAVGLSVKVEGHRLRHPTLSESTMCRYETGSRSLETPGGITAQIFVAGAAAGRLGVPLGAMETPEQRFAELGRLAGLARQHQRRAVRKLEHAITLAEMAVTD